MGILALGTSNGFLALDPKNLNLGPPLQILGSPSTRQKACWGIQPALPALLAEPCTPRIPRLGTGEAPLDGLLEVVVPDVRDGNSDVMDVGLALQGELDSFQHRIGFWLKVDLRSSLLMYRNVRLRFEQFTLLTGSKEPGHVAEGNDTLFLSIPGIESLSQGYKALKCSHLLTLACSCLRSFPRSAGW